MPDRKAKGIWPHPPLKYMDVRSHLVDLIKNTEWFPCDLSGGREGIVIQNIGEKYICHFLYYSAFGLPIISQQGQKEVNSPEEAADIYLKGDLRLPGDLDSWKVE